MSLKNFFCPIHREGYIFIVIGAAFSILVGSAVPTVGWIGAIVTLWIVYFFRDPDRVTPQGDNLIISPADGYIQKIEDALPPEELELGNAPMRRISIFLNIFNVHINRVPASGKITALHYRHGKFLNAANDKASEENERQSCVVKTKNGTKVVFVQIAGLIAKRIVCDLEADQNVISGARFGLIRFGSRADIYLPKSAKINVLEGQTALGGETVLAILDGKSIASASTPKTVAKKVVTKKPAVDKKAPAKKTTKVTKK
jgi:phosphatidylserine decarboxylase